MFTLIWVSPAVPGAAMLQALCALLASKFPAFWGILGTAGA